MLPKTATPLIEAIYQAKTVPLSYKGQDGDISVDIQKLQEDAQPHFEAISTALNAKTTDESYKQSVELILQELSSPSSPFSEKNANGNYDLKEQFKIQLARAAVKDVQQGAPTTRYLVDILSRTTEFDPSSASELQKTTGRVSSEAKPKNKLEENVMMAKLDVVFDVLAEKIAVKNDDDFKEAILWVKNQYSQPLSPIAKPQLQFNGDFEMNEEALHLFANKFSTKPNYVHERRKALIEILSGVNEFNLTLDKADKQKSSFKI